MALNMFVALSLSVFLYLHIYDMAQASGQNAETLSSPAFLIVGKMNGDILRCPIDNPENCETFHEGELESSLETIDHEDTKVWSTVVHGEYLYAALKLKILRCDWNRKFSCTDYHKADVNIVTLNVFNGYLYAGGGDNSSGVILLCELNRPNSCYLLHEFKARVVSMFELNKHIYVATKKFLLCCSKETNLQCSHVRVDKDLRQLLSVSHLGNTIITLSSCDNDVKYYNLTSRNSMNFTQNTHLLATYRVTVFKRNVYVLQLSRDNIGISQDYNNFKEFAQHNTSRTISFAYATHRIHRNQYEVSKCFEQSSPSDLFNYNVEHRAMMEVKVVDGRLRDARDALVDTRRADRGYSGPAAIFAMGPDGQLLLSNAHRSGLVHISSLFAGNPVAGAGEIVVEDGVVKRIIACSVSYWPDIQLNKQVVDELYRKGYEKAEEIKLEICDYTCGRN